MIRVPEPTVERPKILVTCAMVPEGQHTIEIRLNRHRQNYAATTCDPQSTRAAQRLGATTCLYWVKHFRKYTREAVRYCRDCAAHVFVSSVGTCPFEAIDEHHRHERADLDGQPCEPE